jgi:hypothetical protein
LIKPELKQLFAGYEHKERLDHFWKSILVNNNCSSRLLNFFKKILLVSHGNAFVERGFSVNKEVIVENQVPKSLVAQRQVYDGVMAAGGLEKVVISKQMINRVRHAKHEYSDALAEQKENEAGKKKIFSEKKEAYTRS